MSRRFWIIRGPYARGAALESQVLCWWRHTAAPDSSRSDGKASTNNVAEGRAACSGTTGNWAEARVDVGGARAMHRPCNPHALIPLSPRSLQVTLFCRETELSAAERGG